jgi:hypothetical protein
MLSLLGMPVTRMMVTGGRARSQPGFILNLPSSC